MSRRDRPYPKIIRAGEPNESTLPDRVAEALKIARDLLSQCGYSEPPPSAGLEPFTVPWAAARVIDVERELRKGVGFLRGQLMRDELHDPQSVASLLCVALDLGFHHGLLYALAIEPDAARGRAIRENKGGRKANPVVTEALPRLSRLKKGQLAREAAAVAHDAKVGEAAVRKSLRGYLRRQKQT